MCFVHNRKQFEQKFNSHTNYLSTHKPEFNNLINQTNICITVERINKENPGFYFKISGTDINWEFENNDFLINYSFFLQHQTYKLLAIVRQLCD